MKKISALFVFLLINSTYAIGPGWHSKQIKNWGVGTSGNPTGIAYSLSTTDEPGTWIPFDTQLQDTIEKQKILAAVLASIKAMGGRAQIEIGSNNRIVNIFDDN